MKKRILRVKGIFEKNKKIIKKITNKVSRKDEKDESLIFDIFIKVNKNIRKR